MWGGDLRAKWMRDGPGRTRKNERSGDVQEVTDWSREKRKHGSMVSKRGECIGSSLTRRKERPRGEKIGRVRAVPPQAQKIRMLGKETTVQPKSVQKKTSVQKERDG